MYSHLDSEASRPIPAYFQTMKMMTFSASLILELWWPKRPGATTIVLVPEAPQLW